MSASLSAGDQIVAIATKDPGLATILLHLHECLEAAKTEAHEAKIRVLTLENKLDKMCDLQWTVLRVAIGGLFTTLISALSFVGWQLFITHGIKG